MNINSQKLPLLSFLVFVFGLLGFSSNALAQDFSALMQQSNPRQSKRECERNDGVACMVHGLYFIRNDLPKAVEYFQKSCDLNSGAGCFLIGASKDEGTGIAKDVNGAIVDFDKACTLNFYKACTHLGLMYYAPRNVAKDEQKAFGYFAKACNEKNVLGCVYYRQLGLRLKVDGISPFRKEVPLQFSGTHEQ